LIYDTLVEYHVETGEISPALAKQWLVSADSRHFIFYLRNDVVFHDGSPFNSSVVKYNFDRVLDPNHPAYVDQGLSDSSNFPLESVEIISEDIVVINFYQAYAPFLSELTNGFQIVSPSSFNISGDLEIPIGTGPYKLDVSTSNNTFHNLTRFQNHFRGIAAFEELHYYIFVLTGSEFKTAVISHELDFLPTSFPEEIESDEYWDIIQTSESNLQVFGFLNHNNPILSNRIVRQAINYAMNKQDIINTHFGGSASPMNALISPDADFYNETLPGFPYNFSHANILLDNSGFLKGSDGYRFSLDLSGFTLLTNHTELIKTIADSLDLVGIKANFVEDAGYNRFFSGDYDIYVLGMRPGYDPSTFRSGIHSEGGLNTGNYSNPIIDDLIVLGESTPVKQEREYYYSLIESITQDDAPLLFLCNVAKRFAIAKNMSSLVTMDKQTKIVFNYTITNPTPSFKFVSINGKHNTLSDDKMLLSEYQDISIPEYALYFPKADLVLETVDKQPLTVTVKMSNWIQNFIPVQRETGKCYSITVSDATCEYYLRCYYDLNEINSSIPLSNFGLSLWIENTNSWQDLVPIASNNSLRFIEVKLSGNTIIKFGEVLQIGRLTFEYLPASILFVICIGGVIVVIIGGNAKFLSDLKKRYKL
jgi:peptide/nickel transport system substrate-binding protein